MENNLSRQPPLDALMIRWGLSNADLVGASPDQLSFKMVQKGRRGKAISRNVQNKILRALQILRPDEPLAWKDLFDDGRGERVLDEQKLL